MTLKKLRDFNLKDKSVLLRLDINSPVIKGKIIDNPRFKEATETLNYLIKNKAKVAILAHQGRKGDKDFLPLKQHSNILSRHIKKKIKYVNDLFGKEAGQSIASLLSGEAIVLRNVRDFNEEYDDRDGKYKKLCEKFDIFVNDAFSTSHRKQGSIILPPKYLPGCIGINFERELSALRKIKLSSRPSLYLIGGAKIKDYIPLFKLLKNKKNKLLASGVLANLIFISKGVNLGYEKSWLKEKGYLKLLPQITAISKKYKNQIILPSDFAFGEKSRFEKDLSKAPFKEKIWDVGHDTVSQFNKEISRAENIFMKGPLGFSEIDKFSYGTVQVLRKISLQSRKKGVFTILGGGHLSSTIKKFKIPNTFSHISTSGGALISYISGEKLPGITALDN